MHKRVLPLLLIATLVLTACLDDDSSSDDSGSTNPVGSSELNAITLAEPRDLMTFSESNYQQAIRKLIYFDHLHTLAYFELATVRGQVNRNSQPTSQGQIDCRNGGTIDYQRKRNASTGKQEDFIVLNACKQPMISKLGLENNLVQLDGEAQFVAQVTGDQIKSSDRIDVTLTLNEKLIEQEGADTLPQQFQLLAKADNICDVETSSNCTSEGGHRIQLSENNFGIFKNASSEFQGSSEGTANWTLDASLLPGSFEVKKDWPTDSQDNFTLLGQAGQAEQLLVSLGSDPANSNTYEILALSCQTQGLSYEEVITKDYCSNQL